MIDFPLPLLLGFLFILGAFIGSFLNVCVFRIPQHENLKDQLRGLLSPPSSCPVCRYRIGWSDNIPILGWVRLRGRCRKCRAPISIRYPLVELANGLLFVIVFLAEVPLSRSATVQQSLFFHVDFHHELTDWMLNAQAMHLMLWYLYHLVLIEALLVASLIDFDQMIIPDGCTLPAMAVGIAGAFVSGHFFLVPLWYQDYQLVHEFRSIFPDSLKFLLVSIDLSAWIKQSPHWHGLLVSLAGLIVGGGIVWSVRIIGKWILKQEAMGFGDVVLMALIGSFIGWQAVIIVFFLAPLFALGFVLVSLLTQKRREIPYGPYLSLAAVVVLLGWKTIWPAAQKLFATGMLIPVFAIVSLLLLACCLLLLQGVKKLLGIPLTPVNMYLEEWTAADQLFYFSGEQVDPQQGSWKSQSYQQSQFTLPGRGQSFEKLWKNSKD